MTLRIKEILKERGMQIGELAELIELSPQNLSKLLNSKSKPSIETFEKIAEKLNVELWELFTESTSKTELTALIQHKADFYKAESLKELKEVVSKIENNLQNH